jgi:hypothetical protein
MILTEKKPFKEILESLKDEKKIFIFGCGDCAKTAKTGGEPEVLEMKEKLEKEGKIVTGWVIPDSPCVAAQVKSNYAKHIKEIKEADAFLVLACGLGVQSVKENDRFLKRSYPGLNTTFIGVVDKVGNFFEYCSACGDCVLDQTGGICPLTRCPKGLLNGPCGGMEKGKCEVDRDKDCAWVLIYKELEKQGKLENLKKIRQPKDYSKTVKPHQIKLEEKQGE